MIYGIFLPKRLPRPIVEKLMTLLPSYIGKWHTCQSEAHSDSGTAYEKHCQTEKRYFYQNFGTYPNSAGLSESKTNIGDIRVATIINSHKKLVSTQTEKNTGIEFVN